MTVRPRSILALVLGWITALTLVFMPSPAARGARIFVTSLGAYPANVGTVGAYNIDGSPVNPNLISGLNNPQGIALSSGDLFVTNTGDSQTPGTIGRYSTSGAVINPALISGLNRPSRAAVSGNDVFVTNSGGKIGQYTTSGATINPSLIKFFGYPVFPAVVGNDLFASDMSHNTISKFTTSGATTNLTFASVNGLNGAGGMVVADGKIYVTSQNGTIGEYDAATGVAINYALVSGLKYPVGLTLFDGHLFVVNYGTAGATDMFKGYVGEYNLDGTPVNPALITGLTNPIDIVVGEIPEPSTGGLLIAAFALLIGRQRRERQATEADHASRTYR